MLMILRVGVILRQTGIAVVFIMLIALSVGCGTDSVNNSNLGPGPGLVSEEETAKIAKDQGGIAQIDSIEMSTAGPVYRVVFGTDLHGRKLAVWISSSVVFKEELDKGISKEQAIGIALKKGFNSQSDIQLIYLPEIINNHPALKNTSSRVFWWISTPEAEADSIYIDFYNGNIAYEQMK